MLRVADSSKSLYSGVPATFPFQMSPHELFIEPDHLQPVDLAQECVALVLEVFPDTDVEHIHTLVLTQRQTHDDSVGLAERVIDLLTHDTLSEGSEPVGDIECACCFSEVSLNQMAQCVEGHLFCIACVANETSAILESSSPKVKCMDLLGCSAEFPPSELRRVLPVKILNLWERIEARHQLGAAGILTQLTECPFCNWACVLEDDDEQYFTCRNYEVCGVISCRWCRKKNHAPNACEVDEHGQHLVEEAMTT